MAFVFGAEELLSPETQGWAISGRSLIKKSVTLYELGDLACFDECNYMSSWGNHMSVIILLAGCVAELLSSGGFKTLCR